MTTVVSEDFFEEPSPPPQSKSTEQGLVEVDEDFFGGPIEMAPTGEPGWGDTLAEAGKGLVRGAHSMPRMAGEFLEMTSALPDEVREYGVGLQKDYSEESLPAGLQRDERFDQLKAQDPYSLKAGVVEAAEMAAPSIGLPLVGAGVGAVAGSAFGPGGSAAGALWGARVGMGLSLPLYYGSQAKDTYDRVYDDLISQGKSDQEAHESAMSAGMGTGSIEAAGELAADLIFDQVIRKIPGGAFLKGPAKDVIRRSARTWRTAGDMAKDLAKIVGTEVATEIAQGSGQLEVEKAFGVGEGATWEQIRGVIVPTVVLSTLTWGSAETIGAMRRREVVNLLKDGSADVQKRAKAVLSVAQDIRATGDEELATLWLESAMPPLQAGQPIAVMSDQFYRDLDKAEGAGAEQEAQPAEAAEPAAEPAPGTIDYAPVTPDAQPAGLEAAGTAPGAVAPPPEGSIEYPAKQPAAPDTSSLDAAGTTPGAAPEAQEVGLLDADLAPLSEKDAQVEEMYRQRALTPEQRAAEQEVDTSLADLDAMEQAATQERQATAAATQEAATPPPNPAMAEALKAAGVQTPPAEPEKGMLDEDLQESPAPRDKAAEIEEAYRQRDAMDAAAHEAATSPKNDRPEPTPAQQDAGNYKKGHFRLSGLDISVENPEGSTRRSKPGAPKKWESTIRGGHYGYIRGTVAPDGDHLDVFVGPEANNEGLAVYVVDQIDPKTGKYDEPKVMLGYRSQAEARAAYLSNYDRSWKGYGGITPMTLQDFKKWAFDKGKKSWQLSTLREGRARRANPLLATDDTPGGKLEAEGQEDADPVRGPGAEPAAAKQEAAIPAKHGRVLGSSIPTDWKQGHGEQLIGRKVKNARDLARLAEQLRDPRYETFRVFFTNSLGEIVHHTAVSARLPTATKPFPVADGWEGGIAGMRKTMEDVGATGYYLLHNHPNSAPEASRPDVRTTKDIADSVPGFLGHVIINQTEWGHIAFSGDGPFRVMSASTKKKQWRPGYTPEAASAPHPLVGHKIESVEDLAELAKTVQVTPGYIVLLGIRGSDTVVSGLGEIDPASIDPTTARGKAQATALVRRFARGTGSQYVVAVNVPTKWRGEANEAFLNRLFYDVILNDETSPGMAIPRSATNKDVHLGGRVKAVATERTGKKAATPATDQTRQVATDDVPGEAPRPATMNGMRWPDMPRDEGYVYHATNEERLQDIANTGALVTHLPDEFTEQDAWPDGSTQPRSYFSADPDTTASFAPEDGRPVLVRVRREAGMRNERGTGDVYSREDIPSDGIEYLAEGGTWAPLRALENQDADPDGNALETDDTPNLSPRRRLPNLPGLWEAIAEADDAFRLPTSHATDLAEIIREMVPGGGSYTVTPKHYMDTDRVRSLEIRKGEDFVAQVVDPNSDTPHVVIVPKDRGSAGAAVYQAMFTWAHNNNKTMVPDPSGLYIVNALRRTEAMISSMLRHRTSRHVRPDITQLSGFLPESMFNEPAPGSPKVYWDRPNELTTRAKSFLKALHKSRRLWVNESSARNPKEAEAVYLNNLDVMLRASMALAMRRMPQLAYTWRTPDGKWYRDGREGPVPATEPEVDSRTVAAGIGRTTVHRAAVTGGMLREQGMVDEQGRLLYGDSLVEAPRGAQSPVGYGPWSDTATSGDRLKAVALGLEGHLYTDDVPDLSQRQAQTDTPEFKAWFGNSKVVDENGRPARLYHGTSKDQDFSSFRAGNRGIFLADSAEEASMYAMDNESMGFKPGPGWTMERTNTASRVMPLYARIENPYVPSSEEFEQYRLTENYAKAQREMAANAKAAGYDGIKLPGGVWVAFDPKQIKSAVGNSGAFNSKKKGIIETADVPDLPKVRGRRQVDDQALQQLLHIAQGGIPKSPMQKIREAMKGWRARLTQYSLDRFHGLRLAEESLGISGDQSAYIAARMSTSVDAQLMVALVKGPLAWESNRAKIADGGKGLLEILEPLGDSLDLWLAYMVAKRAKRLKSGGREKLITDEQIRAGLALGKSYPQFEQVAREWAAFNSQMLNFAEGAGLIDSDSRSLWENADYIPFYRVLDEKFSGPGAREGLSDQAGLRQLIGGEAPLGNVLENMLLNTAWLIEASMKNHALLMARDNLAPHGLMVKTGHAFKPAMVPVSDIRKAIDDPESPLHEIVRALEKQGLDIGVIDEAGWQGLQKLWTVTRPTDPHVVQVRENGKPQWYNVEDPLLLRALSGTDPVQFGNWIKLFRWPKRLLTNFVTLDPAFQVANFTRDTLASFVLSRDGGLPVITAIRGARESLAQTPLYWDVMAAGGGFASGFVNAQDPEATRRVAERMITSSGFKDSVLDSPQKLLAGYMDFTSRIENANRMGVAQMTMEKGGSALQAAYEAKDLMDFSMRGDGVIFQFFAETVPFFNARLQGLYRLGRGMRENPAAFLLKGALLAAASIGLWMHNKDDERWKELEDWDKDLYWHFWAGDKHYRIPKPFEVGLLFGTLPERLVDAPYSDGDRAVQVILDRVAYNAAETFNLFSVPQAVLPIVEQVANKSFFTDRPIVSQNLQRLQPEAQFEPWTHETSIQIGRALGISPARVDHLLRAYTGSIGEYVLSASDVVVTNLWDFPATPTRRINDYPLVGRFVKEADPPSAVKWRSEFYELYRELDAAHKTISRYRDIGETERALEKYGEWAPKLGTLPGLRKLNKRISDLGGQARQVHLSRSMSPEQKRKALDDIARARNDLYRQAVKVMRDAGM